MGRRLSIAACAASFVVLLVLGAVLHHAFVLIGAALAAGVLLALMSGPGWGPWFVLALLALLAAQTAYQQLDALLAGMHRFGEASFSLSSLGARTGQPDVAFTAVRGWARWWTEPGGTRQTLQHLYSSPRHVAYFALAWDSFVLVPAYASAMLVLLLGARRGFAESENDPRASPSARHLAHRDAYLLIARIGAGFVGVAVVADLLENLGYWAAIHSYWTASSSAGAAWWARLLLATNWWFTILKWVAIGLSVLGLGLVLAGLADAYRARARQLWRVLKTLRGQIVLTLIFGAALIVHPQAPDAIRRWNTRQAVIAFVFAVILVFVAWAFGTRLTKPTPLNADRIKPKFRVLAGVGGAFLVATGLLRAIGVPAWGLLVPAVFFLGIAGLDLLFGPPEPEPLSTPGFGRLALPRLVAVSILVILGIAVLRASVGSFVLVGGRSSEGPLIVWGTVLLVSAWIVYLILRMPWLNEDRKRASWRADPFVWIMASTLAMGFYIWVRLGQNVWATSAQLGAIGVLEGFLVGVTIVVGALMMLSEWFRPPKTLQVMGFHRFPVFILMLGWFLIAAALPFGAAYHDVRFMTVPASASAGEANAVLAKAETPQSVLERWLRRLPPGSFAPQSNGQRTGVPLILVATAGGGIRAAYWTALVLDCLLQPQPIAPICAPGATGKDETDRLLAASGISGGSLGLVSYVAHEALEGTPDSDEGDWVRGRLGGDYLSPSLAWELAIELPRAFLRFVPGMDRAEVIERAWQESWVSGAWSPGWFHSLWKSSAAEDSGPLADGFFSLWERGAAAQGPAVPLLLLNGTSVTDGCRFSTSPLDANGSDQGMPPGQAPIRPCLSSGAPGGTPSSQPVLGATRDLEDFLCRSGHRQRVDVRLSTAALLSARFPFVSPSGRIPYCRSQRQAAFVVDGGYLDASGAATISQFWRSLEPLVARYNVDRSFAAGNPAASCLVPYLIQIDNGYEEPLPEAHKDRLAELAVPGRTLFSARAAVTAQARQDAEITFSQPDASAGITEANRYAHFFPRAHPGVGAPLGWVLSNPSQQDLLDQLAENIQEIQRIRSWLSQPLDCGGP